MSSNQSQKTGPELAEQRVKRRQRQARKELERLKTSSLADQTAKLDSTLIGELKAAQSNNRNEQLKEKVYAAIASGRTETMASQPNARSALRLEALLPDPIHECHEHQRHQRELKLILNREEQFRVHRIMDDDDWGMRR